MAGFGIFSARSGTLEEAKLTDISEYIHLALIANICVFAY
jgi:hypothetical protein